MSVKDNLTKAQVASLSRGLCHRGCQRPICTPRSTLLCEVCLTKGNRASVQTKKNLVDKGLCSRSCGRPLATKTLCQVCREEKEDLRQTYIGAGLCATGCKRVLYTQTLCLAHVQAQRARRAAALVKREVGA